MNTPSFSPRPSRRALLMAGLGAGALAVFAHGPAHAEDVETHGNFLELSRFLTGKPWLDSVLARRYEAALVHADPSFPGRSRALAADIAASGAHDMDAFLGGQVSERSRKTAQTIVSAWYLGIVGKPQDAVLIAFADALMYRPTRGALVVPTYGAGPLAWGGQPTVDL